MKLKNLVIIFFSAFILNFMSQITEAGTDAAAFLNIGVGARALGMGGAFTSVSDDATAAYWNPAGLAILNKVTLATMIQSLANNEWDGLSDIDPKYQFVAVIIPSDKIGLKKIGGTFAISWIYCGIDNVSYTWINTSGELIRDTFNDSENAYLISYGRNILYSGELLVGGTAKIVTQKFTKIDNASAFGYDFDAGLIYLLSKNFRLGFLIQKGIHLKWDNQHTDKAPLRVKLGSSYKFLNKKYSSLLGSIDVVQTQKQPLCAYMGSEFNYAFTSARISLLSLRAGIDGINIEDRYGNIDQLNNNINWTLGTGLKIKIMNQVFQIDYAFGSYRLGSKHRISLITEFF